MKTTRTQSQIGVLFRRGRVLLDLFKTKVIYAPIHALNARALNRELLAAVAGLDEHEVNDTRAKMLELGRARGYDEITQSLWQSHVYRLMLTQRWIAEIVNTLEGGISALDLGAESIAGDYWRLRFPQVQWENTNFDLRFPWKVPASSVDLIVGTELVEHLSDQPNEIFNEGFYKLGFIAFLEESLKALKPGGYLFITTPNAASVWHVRAVLQGQPPWFFEKHVREYTLPEVSTLVQQAGFEITRARDIHCMSVMSHADYSSIFQILLENGFPTAGRGDDLFVVARRPG